jgi:hypothetical protein
MISLRHRTERRMALKSFSFKAPISCVAILFCSEEVPLTNKVDKSDVWEGWGEVRVKRGEEDEEREMRLKILPRSFSEDDQRS